MSCTPCRHDLVAINSIGGGLSLGRQLRQEYDLDVGLAVMLSPQDQVAVLYLGHLQPVMVAAYRVQSTFSYA